MTPLFACFPICLTFTAIGFVGIFAVVLMGLHNEEPDTAAKEEDAAPEESNRPRWWIVVLIFAVVLLHFLVVIWIWPDD
ncbi:MAG: hypothetical protein U0792_03060 [Gemmataceae bacterium]